MVQRRVLNKTKRTEAYYKGSKAKSQWLTIETKVLHLKKHYRSLCRKFKRKHEQELLCKHEQLHNTDRIFLGVTKSS